MRTGRGVAWIIGVSVVLAAAVSASGDDSGARRSLRAGHGFLQRGMIQMALPEYEAALAGGLERLEADEARYGLAVCLTRLARWDEAIGALDGIRGGDGFAFADDSALLRGQSLMMTGRYREAAGAFGALAEDRGGRGESAWAMRLECLYRAGEMDGAVEVWRDGARRFGESASAARGAYYAARAMRDVGDDASAAATLEKYAGDLGGETLGDHRALLLGNCYAELGDARRAIEMFDRVVAIRESAVAPDALLARARLERDAGDARKSAASLSALVERYPESAAAVTGGLDLAAHWLGSGEIDRAKGLIAHAMALGGEAVADEAELLMARCEMADGDAGAAADRLRGVVAREEDADRRSRLSYELGLALWRGGASEEARATLGAVVSSDADDGVRADALAALISMAQESGEDAALVEYCGRFAVAFAGDARAARCLLIGGGACERLGDAARAERMYRDAMAMEDEATRRRAALRLGLLLRETGRSDESSVVLGRLEASEMGADSAPALLAMGDLAWERGDLEAAREHLSAYVALMGDDPSCAGALLTLGLIAAERGEHERAVVCFEKVASAWPDSESVDHARLGAGASLMELGEAEDARRWLMLAGESERAEIAESAFRRLGAAAEMAGDDDAAAGYFASAAGVRGAERAADSRLRMAQALVRAGRFDDAERVFDKLIAETGGGAVGAEAMARRGLMLISMGRDADGQRDLERALPRLDDGALKEAALIARAGALGDEGARGVLESVVAGSGDPVRVATAHYELARLDTAGERYEAAGEHLEEADAILAGDGADAPASLIEGVLYLRASNALARERYGDAADLAMMFLSAHPGSVLVWDAAQIGGDAARRVRRWDDAIGMLDFASGSGDERVARSALLRLGDVYGEAGMWAESGDAFARFLKEHGGDARWFRAEFGRGWAAQNSGDIDGAMACYRRVIDGHDGETAARSQFQIGECLFARGEHGEAIREFMKVDVLYAYPEWSAAALYETGRCHQELGEHGRAAERFREVAERFGDTEWAALARRALGAMKEANGD